MMPSTKLEVHSISQQHRRRTEPQASATSTKIGEDRACDSRDIFVDRQTHRRTHHSTLQPLQSHTRSITHALVVHQIWNV